MTPAELSDGELSAMVAEKVAGWRKSVEGIWYPERGCLGHQHPPFATSADAVLPLLPKDVNVCFTHYTEPPAMVLVTFWSLDGHKEIARAHAATFPRAACLALLAAHQEGGT